MNAMVSNMQEVAARGGRIILITHAEGADHAAVKTLATTTDKVGWSCARAWRKAAGVAGNDFDFDAVRLRHSGPVHRIPHCGDNRDRH